MLNRRMTVNNELERMQKEAAVAQNETLFQHLPGETEESQLHSNYDSWCPRRDSNRAPAEYKSETLISEAPFSVVNIQGGRYTHGMPVKQVGYT